MAGALNSHGFFVCGMVGSFCSPLRSALHLPRRGREKRERGAGGSCHLTCECSGAAWGSLESFFIHLVFIRSWVCEPKEELGEGLALGGKEGGEGTAPLSKCLAQEFTQQAADLRTCLNSTNITRWGICHILDLETPHLRNFSNSWMPYPLPQQGIPLSECAQQRQEREREYRWREGAAGGKGGHCLLVAVGDGKAWVILHKVCVCLNRDLWVSEVLFEQVNVKVSHVYTSVPLERKASQRMLREDRFFVLLFEWWRRNLWNCSVSRLSCSMHRGKYAPPRPQPPQPPPLSAHDGLIQTFSLKPPAALDAGK